MRPFTWISVFCLSVGLVGAQSPPPDNLVATKDKAFMLLPPEVVSSSVTEEVKWSSSGRYVLVRRIVLPSQEQMAALLKGNLHGVPVTKNKVEVVVYSRGNSRSMVVPTLPPAGPSTMGWIYGTHTVLLVSVGQPNELGMVTWELASFNAALGQTRRLTNGLSREPPSLVFHPSSPTALLVDTLEQESTVGRARLVQASGQMSNALNLPGMPLAYVGQDGHYYTAVRPNPPPASGPRSTSFRLDFQSGRLLESQSAVGYHFPPKPKHELQVASHHMPLGSPPLIGQSFPTWLVPSERLEHPNPLPGALLAPDAANVDFSPKGDAVLYLSQGCAFIRGIIEVPREMAIQALRAAERSEAMSLSKQCATGVLMYAADNNDTYPSPADFLEGVAPYVRNMKIMEGFVYTFSGGSLKDIQNPAETEIGYTRGPGGRAVAYADGHVKWFDD